MKTKLTSLYKLCFFAFFIALTLDRTFFFSQGTLENVASSALHPLLKCGSLVATPYHAFRARQAEKDVLLAQLATLEETNQSLQNKNVELASMLSHVEVTQELEEFQKRYNIEAFKMVQVLAKHFDGDEQYFIINKGAEHGIEKDMCATYKFQLVGRVTQVFPYHSKLTLVSDRKSKIAAFTNSTKTHGIVEGTNDKAHICKLAYASHLAPIEEGDYVISSGQGLVIPEGFCLGEVISQKTTGVCHTVEIKPLVDFSKVEYCTLLDRKESISF
jgi:rod shape-determining protein MreC